MTLMSPENFYFLDQRLSLWQKLRIFGYRCAHYSGATILGMVGVFAIVIVIGGLYLGLSVIAMRTLGYIPSGGLSIGNGPHSSAGLKPSTAP